MRDPVLHRIPPLRVERDPRLALDAPRTVRLDLSAERVIVEELDAVRLALSLACGPHGPSDRDRVIPGSLILAPAVATQKEVNPNSS